MFDSSRYYNSYAGRFISEDPIKFFGGDLNLYRYVTNRVGNKIDPSGLREMEGGPIGGGSMSSVDFYFLLKKLYPPSPAEIAKDQESARLDARFAKLFPRYLLAYSTLGSGAALSYITSFAYSTCMLNPIACAEAGGGFAVGVLEGYDDVESSGTPSSGTEFLGNFIGQKCGEKLK